MVVKAWNPKIPTHFLLLATLRSGLGRLLHLHLSSHLALLQMRVGQAWEVALSSTGPSAGLALGHDSRPRASVR